MVNSIDTCSDGFGWYKCDKCAFAKDGVLACANPNIWDDPPRDSYFKDNHADLSGVEAESIAIHLG